MNLHVPLTIDSLGWRGEGMARGPDGQVYVPYTVPGDRIIAEVDGDRGRFVALVDAGPDRIAPFCPYFSTCGGCAVQTLAAPAYARWKRDSFVAAVARDIPASCIGALVDAHGEGRRRATFHARADERGRQRVGFMQARAHDLIEIQQCPILAPSMEGALAAARALTDALKGIGKPLDFAITGTLTGLDVDMRGAGHGLGFGLTQKLIALARRLDLARLSNHGEIVIELRAPQIAMGRARLVLPPGGFLQATEAGQEALVGCVERALAGARRVADLYAGCGTFALRLAERATVRAFEADALASAATARAAGDTPSLRALSTEVRDLAQRPLQGAELTGFDALVFDPPRAGADVQARALAASSIATVVAVSCNAQSFARDARTLMAGGYRLESVTPIDQFRYSPHLETVGVFRKDAKKPKRRLLS